MSRELKKSFDYSVVDSDIKSDLIYFADQIIKARDSIGKSTLELGYTLATAQERLANHSGGVFVQWVETECGFSKSTAYRLIGVYQSFGSFPNLGKLEDSALYALSENSTPEKARREAMKLAEKGESITHAKAKEIIAKHKEQSSDRGKPGGEVTASLVDNPVEDDPVSSSTAAETESARDQGPETGGEDRSQTEVAPPADSKQDREQEFRTQRSKTVKTVEAAMRAFDDLNRLRKHHAHGNAINACKHLLQTAKNWQ